MPLRRRRRNMSWGRRLPLISQGRWPCTHLSLAASKSWARETVMQSVLRQIPPEVICQLGDWPGTFSWITLAEWERDTDNPTKIFHLLIVSLCIYIYLYYVFLYIITCKNAPQSCIPSSFLSVTISILYLTLLLSA